MTRHRVLRALALGAVALVLSACSGLPTSGDAQPGKPLGASPEDPDFLPLASGPIKDGTPSDIVEGFIEAAITPADNWATAKKFLTPEFAETWRPAAGVLVDVSAQSRDVSSPVEDDASAREGDTAEVEVKIDQLASIDESGAYSEARGTSTLAFVVVKTDGQWRISEAPDGVVIDESRFSRVYDDYPLQYFDQTWERLVPDVRWFPRRPATIATTITQSLIGTGPSAWLEPAVQSAFPADVRLARDAVPIDPDQVADVALNRAALTVDERTLSRMRTQLQATLEASGVHVSQVRFTVDGRTLEAGIVKLVEEPQDTGSIVLKDGAFGTLVGREITPIPAITDDILGLPQPVVSIDVAADDAHAAVKLADGAVYLAGDGRVDRLDDRPGLVKPSLDPYGYVWSVPSNAPSGLQVISGDVVSHGVGGAWPNAAEVSNIRVSADGARIAAVVEMGAERWVVVSAVIRDAEGLPTQLGPMKQLTQLDAPAAGLVWLGPDRLGILTELDGAVVRTQIVGGTGDDGSAPTGSASIAGSRSEMGVKVLAADGALFSRSGAAWRESATGVQVLATRAGH
jgi:hypothetical protein